MTFSKIVDYRSNAGWLVEVYIQGKLVLRKWSKVGTGPKNFFSFSDELEPIRQLPDGSYYVSGNYPKVALCDDSWHRYCETKRKSNVYLLFPERQA